jgi:hypothetical protein
MCRWHDLITLTLCSPGAATCIGRSWASNPLPSTTPVNYVHILKKKLFVMRPSRTSPLYRLWLLAKNFGRPCNVRTLIFFCAQYFMCTIRISLSVRYPFFPCVSLVDWCFCVFWVSYEPNIYVYFRLNLAFKTVPWLEGLVAGLLSRGPSFDPKPVHVSFVVHKMAVGQVFGFSLSISFYQFHQYPSSSTFCSLPQRQTAEAWEPSEFNALSGIWERWIANSFELF